MDGQPSFTEAFYKAKAIEPLDLSDYGYRIGWTHRHIKPEPFDLRIRPFHEWDKPVLRTVHNTTVYCHAFLNPALFRLYRAEQSLGGQSDINWAYRPNMYWTFCEECERLWFRDIQPPHWTLFQIFPMNYFPPVETLDRLIGWGFLHRAYNGGLIAWNHEPQRVIKW